MRQKLWLGLLVIGCGSTDGSPFGARPAIGDSPFDAGAGGAMASAGGASGFGGDIASGGNVGAALGCSTDLDCKGSRVCVGGKCDDLASGGAPGAGGSGSGGAAHDGGADAGELGSGGACVASECTNKCAAGWHHCCGGALCACCQAVGTGGAVGAGGAGNGGTPTAGGATGSAGAPACGPGNGVCAAGEVCTAASAQSVFSCYTKGYAGSCDPTKLPPPGATCDGYCQTSPLPGCRGSYYSCSPLFDLATGKQCPLCADGFGTWQCGPP